MSENLKILLIQARLAGDPMAAHELDCFAQGCGLGREQFQVVNVAIDDPLEVNLSGADGVIIGGSGDFSLVAGGFSWHAGLLEMIRGICERGIPTFGSCFGFQAIVQALGGELVGDPGRSEVGTFEISLTDQALADPVFGALPESFDAQLGHNDSALNLGDDLVHLARSESCEFQAIKVRGKPVVATQFHPELTREGSLARFKNYLHSYKQPEQDMEAALAFARSMHRPSPHASSLLPAFLRNLGGDAISVAAE